MVAKQKEVKLTKEDKQKNEALLNAIKFCIYPASITDKTIDVPQDELESGSDDLSVRYLISNYGFKIQSVIPGSVIKKEHFNPVMRTSNIVKENVLPSVTLPKRGEIWNKEGERIYFKNITENMYEITYLNSLKGNKSISKSSIDSLVRNGTLIIEPR